MLLPVFSRNLTEYTCVLNYKELHNKLYIRTSCTVAKVQAGLCLVIVAIDFALFLSAILFAPLVHLQYILVKGLIALIKLVLALGYYIVIFLDYWTGTTLGAIPRYYYAREN